MIDDFKPAPRRPKSLQAALNNLPERQTPNQIESFHTPEQIAAVETTPAPTANVPQVVPIDMSLPADTTAPHPPKKTHWWHKLALRWPPGKKEWITVVVLIVLAGSGITVWQFTHKPAKPIAAAIKPKTVVKAVPKITTVPSNLSGLPVDPSVNNRPVTAVMVENSDAARPQSGLSQAGVVFEAVAEGGVTRFMALYQDQEPTNVGPIRSARPYYVEWAMGFNAGYAHVGGSPDALADIKSWGVRDLDQFYNSGSYHRISSREAPHNVYTGISTLEQLEATKGYTSSTFTSWTRKKDAPAATPSARTVTLVLSGPDYNASYSYNAKTNSYDRSEGGATQTDANTGAQLSPKVVIAMVVPETRGALDATGAYYSDYQSIGSGQVDIFQDGTMSTGTWAKTDNSSQITFTGSNGQPMAINAGQAWVTAVFTGGDISFGP